MWCHLSVQGTELLVWYGESYLQFMGIPVALKEMADMATEQELESRCTRFHITTLHNTPFYFEQISMFKKISMMLFS